uniref:UDP-glycosyltransferases domain-containing protein n=1 Tax=Oryza punctata TaxID=4537 RepID=A0A0E0KHX5_ORYPU
MEIDAISSPPTCPLGRCKRGQPPTPKSKLTYGLALTTTEYYTNHLITQVVFVAPGTSTPAALPHAEHRPRSHRFPSFVMDSGYSSSAAAAEMHVVICPLLAFGHLLPCLDLAQHLASRGHRVSFVSTPRNISRLPPVRPALAPLVSFVALPLPRVDGLPDSAESTHDVPHDRPDMVELHLRAFDGLAAPFSEFLATACADWVIADIFHHWAAAIALEHKVPCAMLLLSSANMIGSIFLPDRRLERAESPVAAGEGQPAAAPTFEVARNKFVHIKGSSGMSNAERFSLTLSRCSLVVVRSCVEFEPETVPLLSTLRGKPVAFLGLMPPSPEGRHEDGEDDTVRWLDAQPAKSVVYVALGSEVPLGVEQVHELALGLELAGTRFLWALRKPSGVSDADLLPAGFEERTRGRGVVATRWVPQMSILAHAAVGAFLTHCGWSSTIEGLLFDHPLIMLPIFGDQGPNARLIEAKNAGVQVARNDGDGSFDRDGVAAAVRAVAVEKESSRVFQANAKRLQEIVADIRCHERRPGGIHRSRPHIDAHDPHAEPATHAHRPPSSVMDSGYSSSAAGGMHVVICPWLAFGHLLPCLDLAQRLASRGHRVSFVSTPRNISRLPPVRPALAPLVAFVALPLPRVEGLPDGAESTNDVPHDRPDMVELHRRAFDGLAAPFSEFLGTACADWVIVDVFHHWAAAAALEHKVPCAMILLGSAHMVASLADRRLERAETESPAVAGQGRPAAAPTFEVARMKLIRTKGSSGMSLAERFSLTLSRSSLVVVRSCAEFEPETVPLLSTLRGKPLAFLGLMPPSHEGRREDGEDDTVRWLDAQPAKSVVYVALGSEVPLRVEKVHELALGLELAGTRFLWALRKPSGVSDADLLPAGFEERTRGRGVVATRWVPQMSILAHAAVGAFLTHCGWNSTIEGLMFGHPLIMLPIFGDQGPNARLMEAKNAGVQVPRNDGDGSFDREGVTAAIRAVAVEKESSRVFQANAKKLQVIVADMACHEGYIDGFIQQLRSYKD